MAQARLKIKHNYREKLSVKHILKCSVINQGCEGGYSYLASKFGHDLEFLPEKCVSPPKVYLYMLNIEWKICLR